MKPELYATIVFLHVISAILAIGPLFIIIPLINRLQITTDKEEDIYLSIIQVIIRIVMHAGHLLVTTGALLILLGPWPWYTSWVVMTVIVMGLSGVFLATGFTRVIKNLSKHHINRQFVLKKLKRTTWVYIGLMLVLLWLMVQKPIFW